MSGIQEQETVPKKRYTNRVTIQRVYANKGDNSYNYQGVKDDKFSGVMIDD